MLHILGMILKIAGILLGSILGILLLILLLILFVPVHYRIKASYEEKAEVHAGISWLLYLVSVRFSYGEEGKSVKVRILGIPVRKKKKKKPVKPAQEEKAEMQQMEKREAEEKAQPGKETGHKAEREETEELEVPKETLTDIIHKWMEKIKCTIQKICDKIKAVKAKKEELQAFVKDENNREAFHLIKRELIRLLRHIRPRKLSASCHFGFDDPAVTGQVLAAGAVFYPVYGNHVLLYPDFEQKVLSGKADMRGRIRIFPLLLTIIRLWRNRTIRDAVSKFIK